MIAAALLLAALAQSPDPTPFPDPGTKKGLQVQSVDDALALGVRHATVNVQLGHLLAREPAGTDVVREVDGEAYRFDAGALAALDALVEPLSDAGAVVYAILLLRATGDARDERFLHPGYDPEAPNRLSAFDARSERGRRFLRASVGLLAERYGPGREHGRVWGWIVGNEVNSHWWWHNAGRAGLESVADDYERAVRLVHELVTARAANARVYVSLEHHWTARFAAGDESQAVPGRELLARFAALARERGDFAWHLAFHPYPEDLFDARWWLDETAPMSVDAPRVTFKNLPVLVDWLRAHAPLENGTRSVVLSEQGFHAPEGEAGELLQAAAYAAAWARVRALDGVDAFILHRHVDHAHEGGLRLGLWEREAGSVCTPGRPRRIREVFARCDGPDADAALAFALDVLGLASWDELDALCAR